MSCLICVCQVSAVWDLLGYADTVGSIAGGVGLCSVAMGETSWIFVTPLEAS